MTRIVFDYPPMIDEIDAAFNVRGKPVIYAWGQTVYNPMKIEIAPQLAAHEGAHCHQQGDDIEGWWRNYIDDPEFRLRQEVQAHQVEYRYLIQNGNRNDRRRAKKHVAQRLASPLYGRLITPKEAERIIVRELEAA